MRSKSRPPAGGFTMTELILVVALISILAAVSTPLVITALRRERINAIATELTAWLEEISLQPERNGTSCLVTITNGDVVPGGQIAAVAPATCDPAGSGIFRYPTSGGNSVISVIPPARAQTFSFTPRGATTNTTFFNIRISERGTTPTRCVRVSPFMGLIQMGRDDAAAAAAGGACTQYGSI